MGNAHAKVTIDEDKFFDDLPASNKLTAQMLMFAVRILPAIASVNNRQSVDYVEPSDIKDFLSNPGRYSDYL